MTGVGWSAAVCAASTGHCLSLVISPVLSIPIPMASRGQYDSLIVVLDENKNCHSK